MDTKIIKLGVVFCLFLFSFMFVLAFEEAEQYIMELDFNMSYFNESHYNEETFSYWDYGHKFFMYEFIPESFYSRLPYNSGVLDFSRLNYKWFLKYAEGPLNNNVNNIDFGRLLVSFGICSDYIDLQSDFNSCELLEEIGQFPEFLNETNREFRLMGGKITPVQKDQFSFSSDGVVTYRGVSKFNLNNLENVTELLMFDTEINGKHYLTFKLENFVNSSLSLNADNIILTGASLKSDFFKKLDYELDENLSLGMPVLIKQSEATRPSLYLLPILESFNFSYFADINLNMYFSKKINYVKLSCFKDDCMFLKFNENMFKLRDKKFIISPDVNVAFKLSKYRTDKGLFLFQMKKGGVYSFDFNDVLLVKSENAGEVFFKHSSLKEENIINFKLDNLSLSFLNSSRLINIEDYSSSDSFIVYDDGIVLLFLENGDMVVEELTHELKKSLEKDVRSFIKEVLVNTTNIMRGDKSHLLLLEEFDIPFIGFEGLSAKNVLKLYNEFKSLPESLKKLIKRVKYDTNQGDGRALAYVYRTKSDVFIYPRYFSSNEPLPVLVHEATHLYHSQLDNIHKFSKFYSKPFLSFPGFNILRNEFDTLIPLISEYGSPSMVISVIEQSGVPEIEKNYYFDTANYDLRFPKGCVRSYGCTNVREDIATLVESAYSLQSPFLELHNRGWFEKTYVNLNERLSFYSENYDHRIEQKIDYLWRMGFAPEEVFQGLFEDSRTWKTFTTDIPDFKNVDLLPNPDSEEVSELSYTKLTRKSRKLIREYFVENILRNRIYVESQDYVDPYLVSALFLTLLEEQLGFKNKKILTKKEQIKRTENYLAILKLKDWMSGKYFTSNPRGFSDVYFYEGVFKKYTNLITEPDRVIEGGGFDLANRSVYDVKLDSEILNQGLILRIPPKRIWRPPHFKVSFLDALNRMIDFDMSIFAKDSNEKTGVSISVNKYMDVVSKINNDINSDFKKVKKTLIKDDALIKHYELELFPRLRYNASLETLKYLAENVTQSNTFDLSLNDEDFFFNRSEPNLIMEISVKNDDLISLWNVAYSLRLLEEYVKDEYGVVNIEYVGNLLKNGYPFWAIEAEPTKEDVMQSSSWIEEKSFGKLLSENYDYLKKIELLEPDGPKLGLLNSFLKLFGS